MIVYCLFVFTTYSYLFFVYFFYSESAADIVKTKKDRGNVLYAEVSPASLACDGNEYWNSCWTHAAGYVTKPPLRKGVADALVESAISSKCVVVLLWSHFCGGGT